MLGFCLVRLHYYDREWTNCIVNKLQSSKSLKIAFWDSYVSNNPLFRDMYDDYRGLYAGYLRVGGTLEKTGPRHAYQSTITHMTLAYFYDYDGADDYFEAFLEESGYQGHDEDGGYGITTPIQYCAFYIAQLIRDKADDEKFNKEKLVRLWGCNAFSGQMHLHMWFKNSPLDMGKTITLYITTLQSTRVQLTWQARI